MNNKFVLLLLLLAPFTTTAVCGAQNKSVEMQALNLKFDLPVDGINVQLSRYGGISGAMGIEVRNVSNQLLQFCLDQRVDAETFNRIYVGALHPTAPDAILIEKGSHDELSIIKILRSWLDGKVDADELNNGEMGISDDAGEEIGNIFPIVTIVNLLQENFEKKPELFTPEYSCFDLHGGYKCHVKTNPAEEPNRDSFEAEKLLNSLGCHTDADCQATKSGGCVAGGILSRLFRNHVQNNKAKIECRCLKGPVEFGCVPVAP